MFNGGVVADVPYPLRRGLLKCTPQSNKKLPRRRNVLGYKAEGVLLIAKDA
jgi:hypothetical protein